MDQSTFQAYQLLNQLQPKHLRLLKELYDTCHIDLFTHIHTLIADAAMPGSIVLIGRERFNISHDIALPNHSL